MLLLRRPLAQLMPCRCSIAHAGVADADASPPPAPPSLRRLPARPTLKLLVLEGMQLVEAAAAAEKDT